MLCGEYMRMYIVLGGRLVTSGSNARPKSLDENLQRKGAPKAVAEEG